MHILYMYRITVMTTDIICSSQLTFASLSIFSAQNAPDIFPTANNIPCFIPSIYQLARFISGYIHSSSPTQMNKIDIQLHFCEAVAVTAVLGVLQCDWTE